MAAVSLVMLAETVVMMARDGVMGLPITAPHAQGRSTRQHRRLTVHPVARPLLCPNRQRLLHQPTRVAAMAAVSLVMLAETVVMMARDGVMGLPITAPHAQGRSIRQHRRLTVHPVARPLLCPNRQRLLYQPTRVAAMAAVSGVMLAETVVTMARDGVMVLPITAPRALGRSIRQHRRLTVVTAS